MNTSHRFVNAKSKFSAAPLAALLLTLIASVALPANAGRRKLHRAQHSSLCIHGEEPGE
jgi:hypothetical protein